jgi:prepilin-type N-terminal cleavage/methylation domain-containing protein
VGATVVEFRRLTTGAPTRIFSPPPMTKKTSAAFTLIELLVVISIIAILAALAVPALTNALNKGQMTGTMNNARQMYLAGFQMATDGAANSDPNYAWPGNDTSVTSLEDYCEKLVANDYLKAGDLQKILNAPGANCTVTYNAAATPPSLTLSGTSALKVYRVTDIDPSNTIFAVTSNYTYNTALSPTAAPYGDKGFVVMRKGGDAGTYRKNQATAAGFGAGTTGEDKLLSTVGRLSGHEEGTQLPTGDNGRNLTNPTGSNTQP